MLIGYPDGVKRYKLIFIEPHNMKVIMSMYVNFREDIFPLKQVNNDINVNVLHVHAELYDTNHEFTNEVEPIETAKSSILVSTLVGDFTRVQGENKSHSRADLRNYQLARDRVKRRGVNTPVRYKPYE